PAGVLSARSINKYTFYGNDIKKGGASGTSLAETAMAILTSNAKYSAVITASAETSTASASTFPNLSKDVVGSIDCATGANPNGFTIICFQPEPGTSTKRTVPVECTNK
ncbi:hypothetical protein MCHI_001580, partial [Candidatus Magnetoovum chiemensis]